MNANDFAVAVGKATNEALKDNCALAQLIFVLDSTAFELRTMHLHRMKELQSQKQQPLIVPAASVPRLNGNG